MRKIAFLIIIFSSLFACKQKLERPTDALDTAREFIRSSLDGKYDRAKELMIQDSLNIYELGEIEKKFKTELSDEDKAAYKKSSIIVHSVEHISDTVVIVNYSNSFKKKQMPVKVILRDGIWQIDFNYTFTGNL